MNKKNISIVYCRTIDYDDSLQQRPHHIMNILSARGYDIHWLDTDFSCQKRKNKMRTKINDNLHVYYDWGVFRKKFSHPDIYFSSWSDRYEDLKDITPKYGVLYDSLDNFKENVGNESKMLQHSDVVFTTSQSLYRLRKKEHDNVVMCPNACFPEKGSKTYDVPKDLQDNVDFNKPVILFSGALARWCDMDLLEAIANQYQLVFCGKCFGIPSVPENFINLGCKSYNELQGYYSHCDITLLPFNRKQEALYSDPIKIYESLVHGKICISSNIEESDKYSKKVVYVSKSREHFLQNIKKALKYKDSEKTLEDCRLEANRHSWYERVDVIEEHIEKLVRGEKNDFK